MDLQPQPPAIAPLPFSEPAVAGQPVPPAPRIKRKHQSSEAEAAPERAVQEAAEPVLPVRTSVRVKLKRSGSSAEQPASSSALSGKHLSEAHGKRKHRHRHRHRSQAVHEEEEFETLTGRQHGIDTLETDLVGSRMQSTSGPGYSHELTARQSRWQSGSGDEQAQAVDRENSGESNQAAAIAASGHTKSEEQEEPDQAAADDTEAASGSHAEHAAAMLSHGMPNPTGDEQAAGQSHVTGAPHSQAQQGGFQMPLDTAGSDLNHLRGLSMTESNAGTDVAVHDHEAEHTLQEEGMLTTQACLIGISEMGQAVPDQYGQHSTPEAAVQGGEDSNEQDWLRSSSPEVASPQQLFGQPGVEGSKSVDQMAPTSKSTAQSHGADGDRAESQLRASRQLRQPK